jgi:peptidoglycan/LPS O-acetylase OafA/YrhL
LRQDDLHHNHRNHQLDLLRIIFATLVLLAHAPELTDGNRSREILSRLTHSNVTFGAFGVDGFFLLSGFLIVRSWQVSPDFFSFLRKRVLRIFPGYIVATLLSTLVVGLLAPGVRPFFERLDLHFVKSIFDLKGPATPSVFPGLPYSVVNGSLWTIIYEFRCYILVALFGICGLYRRLAVWLACTVVLLGLMIPTNLTAHLPWPRVFYSILGDPDQVIRLVAIYFVGGCFYIFRRNIQFHRPFAIGAFAALLCVCVLTPAHFEPALAVFGGYLMFYLGQIPIKSLEWMKKFPDISYGIYLYGWPVESLWIWYRHGSPWVTFLISTVICFVLGSLSWHLVERPMLRFKRRQARAEPALQAEGHLTLAS